MRRHHLLSLLLLALAAASLLLLLQAEVEAGAEGSANYRHFMATLAASNTSSNTSQCSIPPLEVVYNDLAYRKAFWPKVAARCKHEQPRLTYMEVLHTKYFFPFKKYFSSWYKYFQGDMFRWNRSVLASLNLQLSCEANFVSRVYASDDQVKVVVRGASCLLLIVVSEHHQDVTLLGYFRLRIIDIFTGQTLVVSQKRH